MEKYQSRNEVPDKYKWDLTEFFKSEDDFIKSIENIKILIEELKNFVGCTKNAEKLYEFLTKCFDCLSKLLRLEAYAVLVNDQELGNSNSIENLNRVIAFENNFSQNTAFFEPELLKLTKEEYENLFNENKKLEEFRFYLDKNFRFKEHILTENEEKIVAELVNATNNYAEISSAMLNSEHDYGEIKLQDGTTEVITTTNFRNLTRNKDENIRKQVYDLFNKKIDEYSTTNASLLNNFVKLNISLAKIRNYDSSWSAKLFDLNMENKIFQTLIDSTEENLEVLQKYYKLMKRILNLDKLHQYDLNLEMSIIDREYSIEEAQDIVINAVKPLKDEYLNHFEKIIKNKYVDYAQYKGKCSGGYSLSTLDTDSRILMSFNGDLEDVSTLAHEGGHNVHTQFIMESNPVQYREIDAIVAEVASLTNECLLSDYIFTNAKTKMEKLAGLENIIKIIISNLYGAVREGKMELDMYDYVSNGGTLTKEYMDNLTLEYSKKYYGDIVELDNYSKNSWVNRTHYYMNFYLFSYAISISVATNVATKILNGDQEMLDNYYKFLSLGADVWPVDAFEVLGIDLTDKNVYTNAINYMDSLIDKYESLYYDKELI